MSQTQEAPTVAEIWDAIHKRVKEYGWTAYRFSQVSKVSIPTIDRMMKGEGYCNIETARKLAEAIGLRVTVAVEEDPDWQKPLE